MLLRKGHSVLLTIERWRRNRVRYLAAKQRTAGNWRVIGATRAPMQDGDFSRTAMRIRTLSYFATPARRLEYQKRVARAADWLAAQAPVTTEDRVMQLLGLHWAGAHANIRDRRVRELLQRQRADGGSAQTPHLPSDAYATGQVLYMLAALGRTGLESERQRASAFLVRTQREDDVVRQKPGDEDSAVLRERVPLRSRSVDLAGRHRLGDDRARVGEPLVLICPFAGVRPEHAASRTARTARERGTK